MTGQPGDRGGRMIGADTPDTPDAPAANDAADADRAFEAARRVADAVLFEGYLLYPYRSSAQKNRLRWQFGVLAPPGWSRRSGEDPWSSRTETLLEADDGALVHVRLRCLQLETVHDRGPGGWDEGVERNVDVTVSLRDVLDGSEEAVPFVFDGGRCGARSREELRGRLRISAVRLPGPYGVVRLRVDTENTTDWRRPDATREEALRRSLVAAHLLVTVPGGVLLSITDPPEWARPAADGCTNEHTWPALLGGGGVPTVVLSSPIILPDRAEVAAESPGDLFDATEIDEILSLRILALTDEEKEQARGTDRRAAAIVDRLDAMPPEMWARLHGAVRSLRPVRPAQPVPPVRPGGTEEEGGAGTVPWWDPGADQTVSPGTDSLVIGGVAVARGRRVRLRPGRADAQDMFLAGRVAVVEAVLSDVDGGHHLAVSLEDDPAADLLQVHGRFLYFHPEEVEPL